MVLFFQDLSRRSYYSKVDVMSSNKVNSQSEKNPILLSNMPPPSVIPPRFFVPEISNNEIFNPELINNQTNEELSNLNDENKNERISSQHFEKNPESSVSRF
jgi:hypothetical protein